MSCIWMLQSVFKCMASEPYICELQLFPLFEYWTAPVFRLWLYSKYKLSYVKLWRNTIGATFTNICFKRLGRTPRLELKLSKLTVTFVPYLTILSLFLNSFLYIVFTVLFLMCVNICLPNCLIDFCVSLPLSLSLSLSFPVFLLSFFSF